MSNQSRLHILNSTPVLVLSTGYEPLFQTTWKKAISAIFGGRAEVVKESPDLHIKTSNGNFPFPTVVRFLTGVFLGKIGKFRREPKPTKKNLWRRDGGECQYCGIYISITDCTIDHVLPKSKGGKHAWTNIVLSCAPCNQKKGSRLLSNTNMKLKNKPVPPINSDTVSFYFRR